MKGKTILSLAIVLSMLLVVMPLMAVKAAPTTMEVVFENGMHEITYAAIGTNFVVTLKIVDTPAMTQWITEITWDPAVLELQTGTDADMVEGPFLKGLGSTVFLVKTPEIGRIPEATCAFLSGGPATGTGDIAYIKFRTKGIGDSPIHLVQYVLLKDLDLVPCDSVDGLVHVPPPPATPPTAKFTVPGTVLIGETINLDASASTAGYDTLPTPGHTCPITEYKWEIDVGKDGSVEYTLYGVTQSYDCEAPGPVKITLTVTAPDPTPPTASDYVDHGSKSAVVYQLTPITGPKIDVYTERGGEGLGWDPGTGAEFDYSIGWSDAFGPQEEVTVYAKVTYNDEPVEYKPVAFEIIDPTGASRDYRVAFTDVNGIATTSFRIPWEGSAAEEMFGDWKIVGTVSTSEVTRMDICKFRFGYIVSIRGITPSGIVHKGENLGVDVDLQSISWDSKDIFLAIVLYDECGVPIDLASSAFTVDSNDGLASGFSITIPPWAFVGTGHVYVNVFTAQPSAGGVPMCPEGSTIFTIQRL